MAKRFRIASIGSERRGSATCPVDLDGDDRLLSVPGLFHSGLPAISSERKGGCTSCFENGWFGESADSFWS